MRARPPYLLLPVLGLLLLALKSLTPGSLEAEPRAEVEACPWLPAPPLPTPRVQRRRREPSPVVETRTHKHLQDADEKLVLAPPTDASLQGELPLQVGDPRIVGPQGGKRRVMASLSRASVA